MHWFVWFLKRTWLSWLVVVICTIACFKACYYTFAIRDFVINHPQIAQYEVFKEVLSSGTQDRSIMFANLPKVFESAKTLFKDATFLREYGVYKKLKVFSFLWWTVVGVLAFPTVIALGYIYDTVC